MRQDIESETNAIFKRIIWKDSQYERVVIDVNYELQVFDKWQERADFGLSAGERQVLSLSFLAALSRITGQVAPLVMDTPLGRLSEEPRSNVLAMLPEISGQTVLLVTESEYQSMGDDVLKHVGRTYRIVHNQVTSLSRFEELEV